MSVPLHEVALLLAAHGAPGANGRVRRLAAALRRRRAFAEVSVGFHRGEPGFAEALDETAAREVVVVPLMTAAGYYADTVLPAALAASERVRDGRVRVTHAPPLGAHAGLPRVIAARVADLLAARGVAPDDATLLLVGHGTARHRASRDTACAAAARLAAWGAAGDVRVAFLDDVPSVEDAVADAATGADVVALPFLFGGGGHAADDLPRRLGLAEGAPGDGGMRADGRRVWLLPALGALPEVEGLVVDLARRAAAGLAGDEAAVAGDTLGSSLGGPFDDAPEPGIVHLVGAGPGDPGLVTARGLALLRAADVVVHDRLVDPALLAAARPGALLVDAGKEGGAPGAAQDAIHAALVAHARAGRAVVRLQGGDPFVFGRGAEEVDALRAAGVPVAVVPGVSSALAGPAAAGVPVTWRGVARSFAVVSAQQGDGAPALADVARVAGADTVVVLMARAALGAVARTLVAAGRDAATPVACVQDATRPTQRVVAGTLATVAADADRAGLGAPMVLVVGAVSARAAVASVAHAGVAAAGAAAAG